MYKKIFLALLIIIFPLFLFFSCSFKNKHIETYEESLHYKNNLHLKPGLDMFENKPLLEKAKQIYDSMSMKERIGQLIIARVTLDADNTSTKTSPELLTLLQEYKPGGLIFFSKNIYSTQQISKLIKDIQNQSPYPLFISIDEEGGPVNRFTNTDNIILANIPSAQTMSSIYSPKGIQDYSQKIGQELRYIGFNMNFAPVADIVYPNTPSFLKSRIWGDSPKKTSNFTLAFMQGQEEAGVLSVYKHFPGHGAGLGDTHFNSVSVKQNYSNLYQKDFLPYRQAIPKKLSAVMLGHLLVPALDPLYISPLSKKTIFYLENVLSFKGLIITDSAIMKAAQKNSTQQSFEVEAIRAGVNIILDPQDPKEAIKNIYNAVLDGYISHSQIETSTLKILLYKLKMKIIQ